MKSTRDCRSDLSIVRRGNIDNRMRGLANVRVFETYIYCTLYFIYSVLFAGRGVRGEGGGLSMFLTIRGAGSNLAYDKL